MSTSAYSKFGTIANDTNGFIGQPGEPGIGFVLTPGGNYDIQNKNLENVNSIDTATILNSAGSLSVNSDMSLGANALSTGTIAISSIATDETQTDMLMIDGTNTIVKRTTPINPFDQTVNISDAVTLGKVNADSVEMISSTASVYISDITGGNTSGCQIHVANRVGACVFLEADTNNIGVDPQNSYITMSQDGNNTGLEISGQDDDNYHLTFGAATGSGLVVNNSIITDNGRGILPTFSAKDPIIKMLPASVEINKPLTITSIAQDNTNTNLLSMGVDGVVDLTDITTINNFDQSLNTTDSVIFQNITSPGNTFIDNGTIRVTSTALDGGFTPSDVQLHVRGTVDDQPTIFMEGDPNNNQTGNSNRLVFQNNAGQDHFEIHQEPLASVVQSSLPIKFKSTPVTIARTNELSTIGVATEQLEIASTGVTIANDLILPTRVNDNTQTSVLVLDGTNVVKTRLMETHYSYTESLPLSTSTDIVNFINKVSHSANIIYAGVYEVGFSTLVGNSARNQNTVCRLRLNGVNINQVRISKAKQTSNNDMSAMSQKYLLTLAVGINVIELQYKPLANTGRIQDARVYCVKIIT